MAGEQNVSIVKLKWTSSRGKSKDAIPKTADPQHFKNNVCLQKDGNRAESNYFENLVIVAWGEHTAPRDRFASL